MNDIYFNASVLTSRLTGSMWKTSILLILILTVIVDLTFAQQKILKSEALPQKADSCHVVIYGTANKGKVITKDSNGKDAIRKITLSYADMTTLKKKLSSKLSYSKAPPSSEDYNLRFEFFKRGRVRNIVHVSTSTGNVFIQSLSNGRKLKKIASPKLRAYLLWLLDKNKLINSIPKTDLEGLTAG